MQKDFELETILTVTTGINCTNNFDKVFQLAYFVFDDYFISPLGLGFIKDDLKEHLFNIHPEIKDVRPNRNIKNLDKWIEIQKEKYGSVLAVSRYGKPLNKRISLVKSK